MCEFNVTFNGKIVFKDVVYAKMEADKVVLRDVLGESKEFRNCKITEVDVNSTRLVLSSAEAHNDVLTSTPRLQKKTNNLSWTTLAHTPLLGLWLPKNM